MYNIIKINDKILISIKIYIDIDEDIDKIK